VSIVHQSASCPTTIEPSAWTMALSSSERVSSALASASVRSRVSARSCSVVRVARRACMSANARATTRTS
jgi:hypothetical protein